MPTLTEKHTMGEGMLEVKAAPRDRDVALQAVRKDGFALLHAEDVVKGDKEVVMAAVAHCGDAILYASQELLADKDVVLAAVQQAGDALRFVQNDLNADQEEMKGVREVVLAAVKQNGRALRHASQALRADKEIAREAIKTANSAYSYIDESIRSELEDWMEETWLEAGEHLSFRGTRAHLEAVPDATAKPRKPMPTSTDPLVPPVG